MTFNAHGYNNENNPGYCDQSYEMDSIKNQNLTLRNEIDNLN